MHSRMRAPRAPGPRGGVLLGSLPEFRRDTIGLLQQCARDYGDVVRFRIGPMTVHLVNHPAHVEHVLVRHAGNYDKQTRSVAKIRSTCGRSLLSEDGPDWQRHRRLIQPAFRQSHLNEYSGLIRDQIATSLQPWRDVARSGGEIEIVSAMMHLTLRVAARILFGADVAADADVIERALRIVMHDTWRRIEGAIDLAAVSPLLQRPHVRRAVRDIDRVVYRIIAERHRKPAPSDDLLSMLLAAHEAENEQRLSDAELRDAVLTLLLAGHETTANALAWAVLLVAQHPQVEQRLVEDVQRVDPPAAPSAPPTRQRYARLVFEETIRLYPSVWILERRAVDEDVIGGFRIPAGSGVMISPYLLHRHPQFWDAPEDFVPERFAGDAPLTDRHAYIPFGAGPHRCIGQTMALLVAQQVLEHLYREFQLRLVPGQTLRPRPGITLQHAGGIRMTLQQRKQEQP
jgi:enediyne biosynthesis protein E7